MNGLILNVPPQNHPGSPISIISLNFMSIEWWFSNESECGLICPIYQGIFFLRTCNSCSNHTECFCMGTNDAGSQKHRFHASSLLEFSVISIKITQFRSNGWNAMPSLIIWRLALGSWQSVWPHLLWTDPCFGTLWFTRYLYRRIVPYDRWVRYDYPIGGFSLQAMLGWWILSPQYLSWVILILFFF